MQLYLLLDYPVSPPEWYFWNHFKKSLFFQFSDVHTLAYVFYHALILSAFKKRAARMFAWPFYIFNHGQSGFTLTIMTITLINKILTIPLLEQCLFWKILMLMFSEEVSNHAVLIFLLQNTCQHNWYFDILNFYHFALMFFIDFLK